MVQENIKYNKFKNKIKKYNNLIKENPDGSINYYEKLNKYGKKLSKSGYISFGGFLTPQQIRDIVGPMRTTINITLENRDVNLSNSTEGYRILKLNHKTILDLLRDFEVRIVKILEKRKQILYAKKDNEREIRKTETIIKRYSSSKDLEIFIEKLKLLIIEKEKLKKKVEDKERCDKIDEDKIEIEERIRKLTEETESLEKKIKISTSLQVNIDEQQSHQSPELLERIRLLLLENEELKGKLNDKDKEIKRLRDKLTSLPEDKCDAKIKFLVKQLIAFIDYKINVEDVDTDASKFTKPIEDLLTEIEGVLDKQEQEGLRVRSL